MLDGHTALDHERQPGLLFVGIEAFPEILVVDEAGSTLHTERPSSSPGSSKNNKVL